ncbi:MULTISPECIES: helix-turn-helix domain-containing protein [Actinoalloteichus]|uniref:HTH cro/C1-type domain-containing protein n=1 Tax=Actinoalloteichus fjordicus TaxID=1612552 RepID=A0AAC9PRG8_9PSEU|nr:MULTISPECIES: helix-turn-helix transcriptional regulator [Actinoalloteichus]APU14329.1 hypothetical protein UA74_11345 [Actinoalloteichus fjordicus]APU20298.1 hypothetical protein UA75_11430 [Actinoalloteichus sp. GBA129-24]
MAVSDTQGERSLADKLNYLFSKVRVAGQAEYSNEHVAAAIREQGVNISQSYIWALRKGRSDNPTKRHLEALASFFGVPPAYFFDDAHAARVDAQLDLITALRDADVRDVALRTMELDDDARRSVARIVAEISQIRGLRPGGPAGQNTSPSAPDA